MAKTLGDVRKSVKDFNAQVSKKQIAGLEQEAVRTMERLIYKAIVNGLPDETELSEEAESCLSFIEEAVQRAVQQNVEISSKKT